MIDVDNQPFIVYEEDDRKRRSTCRENKKDALESSEEDYEESEEVEEFMLPEVFAPYLPVGISRNKSYTLVLDLDETLIHYFDQAPPLTSRSTKSVKIQKPEMVVDETGQGYFLIRPDAYQFLQRMHKHYELVIFTAAMQDYADWVIDNLDPVKPKLGRLIDFRLYR